MDRPAHSNPFRTARLHALRFRYAVGDSEAELLTRLAAARGRGAIVGPHGSGKTTLCLELAARFRREGLRVRAVRFGDGAELDEPRSLTAWLEGAGRDTAVIVDGAGRLGPLGWWRLWNGSRSAARVIVTAHHRTAFPTVLRTKTSATLLADLCAGLGEPIAPEASAELLAECGGDVRAALRRLYDGWAALRP